MARLPSPPRHSPEELKGNDGREARECPQLMFEIRRLRLQLRTAGEELHVLKTEVANIDAMEREGEQEHQECLGDLKEKAEALRVENQRLERSLRGASTERERVLEEVAQSSDPAEGGGERSCCSPSLLRLQAACDQLTAQNAELAREVERGREELHSLSRSRSPGSSPEATPRCRRATASRHSDTGRVRSSMYTAQVDFSKSPRGLGHSSGTKSHVVQQSSAPVPSTAVV